LKAKDTWDNILSFAEELSNCLLLLESKSEVFQRRRMVRAYSLYIPHEDGTKDETEKKIALLLGSPANQLVVMKDSPGLDEFNYREKAIVLATQICYILFLVSINLGDWGKFI
jgi:hypothetical protein